MIKKSDNVKVAVRVRPLNKLELTKGNKETTSIDPSNNQIAITKDSEERIFSFDYIYDISTEQKQIYDEVAFPIVESVMEGYNGTIFAYGQTGCGKTHTMIGTQSEVGIIPNTFKHVMSFINNISSQRKYLVKCSYIEIYNEEVRDLLVSNSKKLEMRDDIKSGGIYIKDLSINLVSTADELTKFMNIGNKNRHIGETSMNSQSSRSHTIFTIYVETLDIQNSNKKILEGKLNLIDLAGSERQSKTNTTGKALDEAKKINLSLTALSNVINALVDNKGHIPYRDSKLTRLLQDSLGGNSKTVMIAAISPSEYNFDESVSTLRYASRANAIKNKPKLNEDPKDTKIKQYEDEIRQLKLILSQNQPTQNNKSNEVSDFNEYRKNNIKKVILLEQENEAIKNKEIEKLKDEESGSNDKTVIKRLKNKIKDLQSEIKGIRNERERDTEDLILSINELTKESKLYLGILRILLRDAEIKQIHMMSSWDDNKEDWNIIPFKLEDKLSRELKLPSLHKSQIKEWVNNEKSKKELVINNEKDNNVKKIFSNYTTKDTFLNTKDNTTFNNKISTFIASNEKQRVSKSSNKILPSLNGKAKLNDNISIRNSVNITTKNKLANKIEDNDDAKYEEFDEYDEYDYFD